MKFRQNVPSEKAFSPWLFLFSKDAAAAAGPCFLMDNFSRVLSGTAA